MAAYSTFVNTLDYASCVVPVTVVDKAVDTADVGYIPLNKIDGIVWENCRCTEIWGRPETTTKVVSDDADMYDGAHVGVQIVGRRLQEEKVLALAELAGRALQALQA